MAGLGALREGLCRSRGVTAEHGKAFVLEEHEPGERERGAVGPAADDVVAGRYYRVRPNLERCKVDSGIPAASAAAASAAYKLDSSWPQTNILFASFGPDGRALPLGGRTHWEPWSWFSPHVVLGCYRFTRERRGGARQGRSSVVSALPLRPDSSTLSRLLRVCELLKANLYEFHKFNRESGGEVYFTMPRLQSITIQCLEALQFLHGLGLIHCDLKPENILVKSYSRCEVKVIDLGSSCFETDHLCSYVQSRSYRAPELILGLPYDKKTDIWPLGCILAELCTENETNRLEYLIPKKTSLQHRLPMADQGFIEFVAYLLEINPKKRPSASEALKYPWLSYPYEPISS
uniref:Protein kinase domain-containing protein n=1 Tax=Ananas comosus var. bracteatus TaxID=296719 RepID=A0A6V7PHA1_ANACO|nr:unnamed protein product [Ananas comosus var. bracteatus]